MVSEGNPSYNSGVMTETILHNTSSLDGLSERFPPEPHLHSEGFDPWPSVFVTQTYLSRAKGENMASIRPFQVDISKYVIDNILTKVSTFPWDLMSDDDGWEYGANLAYMKDLCRYWVEDFDWKTQEQRLNEFSHFKTSVDGRDIHFIHERGSGGNPTPLLISHGWPGSVTEFLKIIQPLAHPEKFGGNIEDAFDVVTPSLPGFGFSDPPPRPYGPRKMAGIFDRLMTENLGYEKYVAQGGDWGGAISSWLGFDHPQSCRAIHLNIMTMRHPDGPSGREEEDWATAFESDQELENGYRTQQATKPQTLAYAMVDSPVGIAAWITEKFKSWSDLEGEDIESVYTKDELLTNIMVYITTATFNTASWIYYGRREEGGRVLSPFGRRVEIPTGCAVFPKELLAWPPQSYVSRVYNVTHWTEFPHGGHFAAMEHPDLLVEDIRKFVGGLII